ncbi:hypothetical protein ACFYZ9_11600 [Streptomyces sp. NPDC001691]|uniref:hypothetical protein n=1 Tax=unclassified Streptomyces TaxID=2593676 RepID=UPI000DE87AD9|nr:hypothetical protein [Streptomyces sp. SDr-06]RCH69360.1 hypothetical protein DT019_05500 [Streptomyces sp. SDr-06]
MILWMILLALILYGFGLSLGSIVFWVAVVAALLTLNRRVGGGGSASGGGSGRMDSDYRAYRARRDRMDRWERRYRRERQGLFSRHRN